MGSTTLLRFLALLRLSSRARACVCVSIEMHITAQFGPVTLLGGHWSLYPTSIISYIFFILILLIPRNVISKRSMIPLVLSTKTSDQTRQ